MFYFFSDLIYLMLDIANENVDRALAEHLCQLYSVDYHNDGKNSNPSPIDRKTFAQYISYAKE